MTHIHPIVLVLNLPAAVPALIVRATAIHDAMAANAGLFPSPTPTLVTLATDITNLTSAESATKTRTAGTVATRDEKRKIVVTDLQQLKGYVETLVNASPDQAASIAQAAAMSLRKPSTAHKSDLAVKQTAAGTVKVVAKAVAGGRAHDWQYSTDNKTWTNVESTLQASTTIGSLPTGVVYFRHRPITKTGPLEWSQPVSMTLV
jgi:hypothetical protein